MFLFLFTNLPISDRKMSCYIMTFVTKLASYFFYLIKCFYVSDQKKSCKMFYFATELAIEILVAKLVSIIEGD